MLRFLVLSAGLFALLAAAPRAGAQSAQGERIFLQRCSQCHIIEAVHAANSNDRIPAKADLSVLSPERILEALTTGPMAPNAQGLSKQELIEVAQAVALRPMGSDLAANTPMSGKCEGAPSIFPDPSATPMWNGWSVDPSNSRYQPANAAGMTAADIGRLQLKWAFGFPGGDTAFGQPTIVSGRVFVGNNNGMVYAIDAKTGCHYWHYAAHAAVRTAVSVGRSKTAKSGYAAYFGDLRGVIHAVDALTGAALWQNQVDDQPFARITGAPVLAGGRLIVVVASHEESGAAILSYACCKFRGKVLALNPDTGKAIWVSYTIPEAAKPTKVNAQGVQLWGPAGASIWSSPTIDLERNAIYVATGNTYSAPATNSDSVIAFDFASGKMLWVSQLTKDDVWISGCTPGPKAPDIKNNCPEAAGPDADIAGSAILHKLPGGRRILIVGQKNGLVHAIDPDRGGEVIWEARVGKGAVSGGVLWGSAADEERLYAAVSDPPGPEQGGISALRFDTGEIMWRAPSPFVPCESDVARGCERGQRAALTVIPGVVFSGSQNGFMRGYAAATGRILWEYDSRRAYKTVNGIPAKGGSLDGPGPTVADGMLFFNSGYGPAGGARAEPGNVLLAFGLTEAAH
jgi:polyvinyl alcohol dehydrogenase (cytochrome)